ncbi:MAG: NIPSNAP family protein, partial [Planctomycetales bacterium]|nr:NIPSNAP family protein [Planctomycetales bacterium]
TYLWRGVFSVSESQLKRRAFLKASAAVGGALSVSPLSRAATGSESASREYYEWRTYRVKSAEQSERVVKFVKEAALPAWKRLGIGPVGVFRETGDQASSSLHVLLTFPRWDLCAIERTSLEDDAGYREAAAEYLAADKSDPAFESIDSWWMSAFAAQPQLLAPEGKPRCYELRTYYSHSEAKARRKIEMFNAGEIPIFKSAGFSTVFFGEALVGSGLPHLKYMLAAPDKAANDAGWQNFINHPDWAAMKDLPQYADTVSRIERLYLEPLDFSEV